MESKKPVAVLLAIVVLSSVAAVAIWYPRPTPSVRIGYLSQDLHQLALRIAYQKGWFAEEGINVTLLQYQNGAYEMDGFLAGQIDMGYLGAAPALTKSIAQHINITVLATANLEGSSIMVLKGEYDEGRIVNVSGLANKTIFHPGPSSVQSFLLRLALNQSGISVTDVSLEQALPQNMVSLLTPEKPAFIAWEPFCALAEHSNLAVPILSSHDIWPRHPCCVLATSNAFLKSNLDIVSKIVEIHKRAEIWINSNPVEALSLAVQWLQVDSAAVQLALNRIIYDYSLNRTAFESYLTFLISQHIVTMQPTEISPFLDRFINGTFI
jgi:NitT/TauT family transport system substrate-binding protein